MPQECMDRKKVEVDARVESNARPLYIHDDRHGYEHKAKHNSEFLQTQRSQVKGYYPNDEFPFLPYIGNEASSRPSIDYSWPTVPLSGFYAYDDPYYEYWGHDHALSSHYFCHPHPRPPYRDPQLYFHRGHNSFFTYQNNSHTYQEQHRHKYARKRTHHYDYMATISTIKQENLNRGGKSYFSTTQNDAHTYQEEHRHKYTRTRTYHYDDMATRLILQQDNVSNRKQKKKRAKRSDDMPRYPLSAYNFFFSEEREILLAMLPSSYKEGKMTRNDGTSHPPPYDPISNDGSETQGDDESSSHNEEMMPKFCNQQDELRYIQDILSIRNLPKEEMEELQKKIKANSKRILGVHWEGDKVKKSHKKSHGKVTFQVLSRLIGQRWRDLPEGDEKSYYFELAKKDMERYKKQMEGRLQYRPLKSIA